MSRNFFVHSTHNYQRSIEINHRLCTGCFACYAACPLGVIGTGATLAYVKNPKDCIGCMKCIKACLVKAIRPKVERPPGFIDFYKQCPICGKDQDALNATCKECGYAFPEKNRHHLERPCPSCGADQPVNAKRCSACGMVQPFKRKVFK